MLMYISSPENQDLSDLVEEYADHLGMRRVYILLYNKRLEQIKTKRKDLRIGERTMKHQVNIDDKVSRVMKTDPDKRKMSVIYVELNQVT